MADNPENIKIVNTTKDDFKVVLSLFDEAMKLQGRDGYRVWNSIDRAGLKKDIEENLQFKIVSGEDILCVFSVQYQDPLIWGDRDQSDAIYLHRMVTNVNFRGQRYFGEILKWAKQCAQRKKLKYIRMDTWAENKRIIDYYLSYGFVFVGKYRTSDSPELPIQNRNVRGALLQMEVP